jgi:hypothetical protein
MEGQEQVTLFFSEPVILDTLPDFLDAKGRVVVGSWTTSGNTAVFTPAKPWSFYEAPVNFDTSVVLSTQGDVNNNGVLITDPGIPPIPPAAFAFVSALAGGGDGILVRDFENAIVSFNAPVNATTMPMFVDNNGVTILGTWISAGNDVIFTPSAPWQTYAPNFSLNTAGITSSAGGTIAAPQLVAFQLEPAPVVPFTLVSWTTGEADGNVRGREPITFVFSESASAGSLPTFRDATNATVGGAWNSVPGGGRQFTPNLNWETFTGPFSFDLTGITSQGGTPISSPSVLSIPLGPVVPLAPFTLGTLYVQSGAASIVGTRERIAAPFSREPGLAGFLANAVVTRTDNNTIVAGDWAFVGNEAWFRPDNNWPVLSNAAARFRFRFNGIVASADGAPLGGADSSGNVIQDLFGTAFSFVSSTTAQADNLLYNLEQFTLTFTAALDPATLPNVRDHTLATVPGSWVVNGANATFNPTSSWQTFVSPISVDTGPVRATNGVINSNAVAVVIPVGEPLIMTSLLPAATYRLAGTDAIVMGYNQSGVTTDATVTENGVAKAGSWANGFLNDRIFTPASAWARNATVVVDWSGAARGVSTMSNPGSRTYTARDFVLFVSAAPANNSFLGVRSPIVLNFDRPINVATLPAPRVGPQPISGSWSGSGNTATFTPSSDMPAGAAILVDYGVAASTDGLAVNNPGLLNYNVAAPLTFDFAMPFPGTSFTGRSQLLLVFNSTPLQSSLPTVIPVINIFGIAVMNSGTWSVVNNTAQFTPNNNWTAGTVVLNTGNYRNLAGELSTNPTSLQWTATA